MHFPHRSPTSQPLQVGSNLVRVQRTRAVKNLWPLPACVHACIAPPLPRTINTHKTPFTFFISSLIVFEVLLSFSFFQVVVLCLLSHEWFSNKIICQILYLFKKLLKLAWFIACSSFLCWVLQSYLQARYMVDLDIQVPTPFDPFAEARESDAPGTKEYVHIRIQQRNGKKSLTTVQGLKKQFSYEKILKDLKKDFCCNGNVVQDKELGQIIQLQGDQRKKVSHFLVQAGLVSKDQIKIHGF
ncbi:hypothetical protein VNO77_43016 [Canavalia gladiata]|uniref:SUI1 domain-containing protein n=1 Tax=Canavalia gladiata TaxID=3824 RepID=A0AAN9JW34_CANGL